MPSKLTPSQRAARTELISSLRSKGCTYDKVAEELLKAGYTTHQINRSAVYKLAKAACPHLMGNLKRQLDLDRLIKEGDPIPND